MLTQTQVSILLAAERCCALQKRAFVSTLHVFYGLLVAFPRDAAYFRDLPRGWFQQLFVEFEKPSIETVQSPTLEASTLPLSSAALAVLEMITDARFSVLNSPQPADSDLAAYVSTLQSTQGLLEAAVAPIVGLRLKSSQVAFELPRCPEYLQLLVSPEETILGREKLLRRLKATLLQQAFPNILLVGPRGSGRKTTLAKFSRETSRPVLLLSTEAFLKNGLISVGDVSAQFDMLEKFFSEVPNGIFALDAGLFQFFSEESPVSSHLLRQFQMLLRLSRLRQCVLICTATELISIKTKASGLADWMTRLDVLPLDEDEPTVIDTIIQTHASRLSKIHQVQFTPLQIQESCRIARDYNAQACLPGSAITLLDHLGAMARSMAASMTAEPLQLSETDFYNWLADALSVDPIHLKPMTAAELDDLENSLRARVFGQDPAIVTVTNALRRARSGFREEKKPIGSFLFVGPTGVGKTELTIAISEIFRMPLVRLDMSEYKEKHAVSTLIGAPPGYVGYDQGGTLTNAVRATRRCVVLVDEIEKAHPEIADIFLQILDNGILHGQNGLVTDFRQAIIIMTSNVGAAEMALAYSAGLSQEEAEAAAEQRLKQQFRPEMLNRFSKIVRFKNLSPEVVEKVVNKELQKVLKRAAQQHVSVDFDASVISELIRRGKSSEYGARGIQNTVADEITSLVTIQILSGRHYPPENPLRLQYTASAFTIPDQPALERSSST